MCLDLLKLLFLYYLYMTARTFVGVAPRAGVGLTTLFINFAHIIGDKNRVLYVDLDILNLGRKIGRASCRERV